MGELTRRTKELRIQTFFLIKKRHEFDMKTQIWFSRSEGKMCTLALPDNLLHVQNIDNSDPKVNLV